MDLLLILQTALLYVIRGILEFLDKEGLRLSPQNISHVQEQVMAKLQESPLMSNITDQALIRDTIQGMLLDRMVFLPEDIVPRSTWNATSPKSLKTRVAQPYESVVIHDSQTNKALSEDKECQDAMRQLQAKQMREMNQIDIAYNFVLCGDGTVYEGTGWDVDTEHAPELGRKSLGVLFLRESQNHPPDLKSLKVLDLLLQAGVTSGKLSPTYHMYSHSQLVTGSSPGTAMEKALRSFRHYDAGKESYKTTSKGGM